MRESDERAGAREEMESIECVCVFERELRGREKEKRQKREKERDRPDHVPRRLRHTIPSTLRLGFKNC